MPSFQLVAGLLQARPTLTFPVSAYFNKDGSTTNDKSHLQGLVTGGQAIWSKAGLFANFNTLTTSFSIYDGGSVGLIFGYRNHLVRRRPRADAAGPPRARAHAPHPPRAPSPPP